MTRYVESVELVLAGWRELENLEVKPSLRASTTAAGVYITFDFALYFEKRIYHERIAFYITSLGLVRQPTLFEFTIWKHIFHGGIYVTLAPRA